MSKPRNASIDTARPEAAGLGVVDILTRWDQFSKRPETRGKDCQTGEASSIGRLSGLQNYQTSRSVNCNCRAEKYELASDCVPSLPLGTALPG